MSEPSSTSIMRSPLPLVLLAVATAANAQGIAPIPYRMDPRAPASAKRLEHATIFDSAYKRQRDIWIYTPAGYDSKAATPYPLIVAFDGAEYRDTMPLPFILDTLLAEKAAPPAVTVDPRRVIVTGSSAGGLGAAFVAFERPDLFGNVLSQSGAFWRGAEASNDEPYEWLTAQVSSNPKKDVRFYMDVGEYENHATLGGSGPNFLAANRRFRDALLAKGYRVTYTEIPRGMHAPQYWMTALPAAMVELLKSEGDAQRK